LRCSRNPFSSIHYGTEASTSAMQELILYRMPNSVRSRAGDTEAAILVE
jgi:hypothetical protein